MQRLLGARLMRRREPFGSAPEEIAALRQTLATCPGVGQVHSIEPHRKGGYAATLDFSMEHLEALIEHLEQAGWMNVL
jgi:hypothetical protein